MSQGQDDGVAVLPAAARVRVVALASDRLSTLGEDQVPLSLRPFRRFTPRKRAQLAAAPLASALESDPVFRQLVCEQLDAAVRDAVRAGVDLPAAPAEELAAAAYLLRPDGWQERVSAAAAVLEEREQAARGAAEVDAVQRLTEQLESVRQQARAETARLSAALEAAQAENVALRRRVRETGSRAAAAERALAQAGGERVAAPAAAPAGAAVAATADAADTAADAAADAAADPGGAAEVRRLRARLRVAEQALTAARAAARGERTAQSMRLRVLLDAVVGAAGGLRRELALPPLEERPADAVAAGYAVETSNVPAVQGRSSEDPALLDELLRVPAVHLLVDGYNVTKSGYGEQALEVQRNRLLAGLGALAARTGAEVTVVFDGAGHDGPRPVGVAAPRGVRLVFSPVDVIADDVLLELVGHEPVGRPLVVVSTDGEVAGGARRAGARAVPSAALLALLDR